MITLTLTPDSADFPTKLRHLPQIPRQLFVTENFLSLLQQPLVAIVGSRKVTPYGQEVTETLARQLAEQGIGIVSGLAFGVDSRAHRACLDAKGNTIAVLPGPLEKVYPASHHSLAQQITQQGGALVSEYPAGSGVQKYQFIERNRLIAGLADAVIITEAAEKSGSLYTATFALEQGIPVFAVPGNITSSTSVGTNNLLKSGAIPVTSVHDVLNSLGIQAAAARKPTSDNPAEQTILDLLDAGLHDGHALLERSQLEVSLFNQSLTMLEITGRIRALGGNQWSIYAKLEV
jgi:DNA processing protein